MDSIDQLIPTLPWESYVHPAGHSSEIDAVGSGAWHYVGTSQHVPDVGSQMASRAGSVPMLIVRAADGIRVFVNACRHRGAELVGATACSQSIRCPYHAWTYGLDGQLRAAPRLAAELGRETSAIPPEVAGELGLVELRMEQWGPFLFVALDAETRPLGEWLGVIPDMVARAGIDVDDMRLHARTSGDYGCNWKVCCENYLECYHCQVAHPGFSAVVDVRPGEYELGHDGDVAWQWAPVRSGSESAGEIQRGLYCFVFPNLMINVAPGIANLSIGPVIPTAVDSTHRFLDYLFADDASPEAIDELIEWDTQVGDEDLVLVEAVQRGMGSGISSGVMLPQSELLVRWFADRVHGAVSGA